MKTNLILPLGLTLSLALLAACQKPASQTAADASATASGAAQDTAAMAAAAPANATAAGGAVSPAQPNGAVNADANTTSTDVAAASNSFTEGQAKGHIEHAGYTEVTNLMKSPSGIWTADAKKAGKPVSVALDFKGAVTEK